MTTIDEAKLGEFMGRMIGFMSGGAACFGIWLGDELGLYTALADRASTGSDDLAAKVGATLDPSSSGFNASCSASRADRLRPIDGLRRIRVLGASRLLGPEKGKTE